MTWSRTLQTGRGTLSYRLEIERLSQQFVTHKSMANQVRLPGLKIDGKLKCLSNPVSGEIDVSGLTVSILDIGGQATAIFGKTPEQATYLASVCTSAATSMSVQSTTGWASAGTLWIDSEAMDYSGITATTFTGLTRGALGSLAQSHYIGTDTEARYPEINSSIDNLAGCRARLYVYGDNDDPQGDGTQIWLGVVVQHPTMDGTSWSMLIDPITSVLTRTLAGDLAEPATPRGVKYDWVNQFIMEVRSSEIPAPQSIRIVFPESTSDTAFFESNEDFADYANTKLSAAITAAGWDVTYDLNMRIVSDGPSGWHVDAVSDGTVFQPEVEAAVGVSTFIDPVFVGAAVDDDGVPQSDWAPGTVYHFYGGGVPGAGSVPRGYVGTQSTAVGAVVSGYALETAFPMRQVFLGGGGVPAASTSVAVKWLECGSYTASEDTPSIDSADAATNSVTLAQGYTDAATGRWAEDVPHAFTAQSLPEFRFGRTYTESGSLWTALVNMVTLTPDFINLGAVPDIRLTDFDGTSWAQLDLSSQPRIVSARRFTSYSDVPLLDLIKNDLLLAGYMLGVNEEGAIAIAPIRSAVATEFPDFTIEHPIVSDGLPTWQPTAYGSINAVTVARGYSPLDDEHKGSPVIVKNVLAFGKNPRTRMVTIEPKSTPYTAPESPAEVLELAMRLFSAFSGPYAVVSLTTTLQQYETAKIGAVGAITSPHLPNASTGERGVTGLRAMVTGREVDLRTGEISLRLYAATDRVGGYAPASRITAETNTSGNTWALTLASDYFPTGTDAADWFESGDVVNAMRWNSTASTTYPGLVASAAGNVVTVTFAGSAAGLSSDTWFLTYADADQTDVETQAVYCYTADATARVDFSALAYTAPARLFG